MDASAGAVAECFRSKSILITGSTGYLGKIVVEKILRVEPKVKKLYLVVRSPDAASAEQRVLKEIVGKDLFNVVRERHGLAGFHSLIKEKVVPMAGDVTKENFGLDSSQVAMLLDEIDIVINGAATTSFYERYDVALASNALGCKHVCDFAKRCAHLKMLLHVSTAFAAGTQDKLLPEKPFVTGETLREGYYLDIEAELKLVERVKAELTEARSGSSDLKQLEKAAMRELGLKRASHFGWPNVYALTKAMGEMLLGELRGDLPVVIVRPSIVTSTYQDPFPGWIEGIRTVDAMIVAYDEQALPCFIGDRNATIDTIPADMVVNAMMVAIATHLNEKVQEIYHVTSSLQNPLPGYALEDTCWDYFSINPRGLENGRPVLPKRLLLFSKFAYFHAYMILMYKLPLEILHAASILLFGLFSRYYTKFNRSYNFLMLLAKLYEPYAFFKGRFDDTNLTRLRTMAMETHPNDARLFNFDPGCIDWHKYFLNTHIPAVLEHARKRKTGTAQRRDGLFKN